MTDARIENLKGHKNVVNWLQRSIKRCHNNLIVLKRGDFVQVQNGSIQSASAYILKTNIELHVYKHCINVLTRDHDLVKDLQFYLYGGINLFYKSQEDQSEFEIDLTWEVINSTLNSIKLIKR
jgi:hypothetical protein